MPQRPNTSSFVAISPRHHEIVRTTRCPNLARCFDTPSARAQNQPSQHRRHRKTKRRSPASCVLRGEAPRAASCAAKPRELRAARCAVRGARRSPASCVLRGEARELRGEALRAASCAANPASRELRGEAPRAACCAVRGARGAVRGESYERELRGEALRAASCAAKPASRRSLTSGALASIVEMLLERTDQAVQPRNERKRGPSSTGTASTPVQLRPRQRRLLRSGAKVATAGGERTSDPTRQLQLAAPSCLAQRRFTDTALSRLRLLAPTPRSANSPKPAPSMGTAPPLRSRRGSAAAGGRRLGPPAPAARSARTRAVRAVQQVGIPRPVRARKFERGTTVYAMPLVRELRFARSAGGSGRIGVGSAVVHPSVG